jgi:hypothetical protein
MSASNEALRRPTAMTRGLLTADESVIATPLRFEKAAAANPGELSLQIPNPERASKQPPAESWRP